VPPLLLPEEPWKAGIEAALYENIDQTDIRQMTSLMRPSFARNGIIGKAGLGQVAFVIRQSRDVRFGST
jgi:hypothetical protein